MCDGPHDHRGLEQTAISIMPTRATERPETGTFKDHGGGGSKSFTPFNFLLSFELFVSSQQCPMVMRGNHSAVSLSKPSNDFASVPSCVLLCMPLSSQIDRKRKRSTGTAWDRTLEGSAFTECPICGRRASTVCSFAYVLQCCGLTCAPCTA